MLCQLLTNGQKYNYSTYRVGYDNYPSKFFSQTGQDFLNKYKESQYSNISLKFAK